MTNEFYKIMEESFRTIINYLDSYSKSETLNNYFCKIFESNFYSLTISSFFSALNNQQNIDDYDLSMEKTLKIKQKYKDIQKEVQPDLSGNRDIKKINKNDYIEFKLILEKDFPEIKQFLLDFEEEINIQNADEYLFNKKEAIKNSGKQEMDSNGCLLINLYKKWAIPLDLLECLINLSLESGKRHADIQKSTKQLDFKLDALVQIHARALHISNEILVLLKAGYPDGANARWRSLHELAVISVFLGKNDIEVSKRYLEYRVINVFKDAQDYQKYYKKLGYQPMKTSVLEKIKEEKNKLCAQYGNDFYKPFGWIPSDIFTVRSFKDFEMKVEDMDAWRPHYNRSSASIHGISPRGFHRLGLKENQQYKVLLTGPSDHGLDNPLASTAISLMHVSTSLLKVRPDDGCIRDIFVIRGLVIELNNKCFEIQDSIEK